MGRRTTGPASRDVRREGPGFQADNREFRLVRESVADNFRQVESVDERVRRRVS